MKNFVCFILILTIVFIGCVSADNSDNIIVQEEEAPRIIDPSLYGYWIQLYLNYYYDKSGSGEREFIQLRHLNISPSHTNNNGRIYKFTEHFLFTCTFDSYTDNGYKFSEDKKYKLFSKDNCLYYGDYNSVYNELYTRYELNKYPVGLHKLNGIDYTIYSNEDWNLDSLIQEARDKNVTPYLMLTIKEAAENGDIIFMYGTANIIPSYFIKSTALRGTRLYTLE
jgi:hypothetical protein